MAFDTSSYDLLKKSKNQEALLKKNNALTALDSQETGINNNYADLMATLQKRKTDAETVKQNQLNTGENNFNTQRDQAVQGVNNSMASARDWLANHGIAGSNENADQMGRLQTRLGNTLSSVQVGKNSYDNGVMTNYNGMMSDIGNSQTSADREKAQKIADILASRSTADNTYNSELQSINDSVEAQKLQDLNAYNERLRQEEVAAQQAEADRQFQAQQAALSRAVSAAKSSSTKASTKTNGLTYKDYFTQGNSMLNATEIDGDGNKSSKYSNTDVYNWISGLNLSPENKANLANDLGIKNPNQASQMVTTPYTSNLYNYVQRYAR